MPLEELKINNSDKKPSAKKETIARNKIIIDDDEYEDSVVEVKQPIPDINNNSKASKAKSNTGKKLKIDEAKEPEEKKEAINENRNALKKAPETNAFMKMLEIKSKDLEKKVAHTDDVSKLSLKERLALKASKGNINDFYNAIQNFSTSDILKVNPYSREISNEEVINDLIEKGKKSTEKK